MPTWPATLPQQLSRQGYSESLPDNVLRSEVEAGPEKTRRRFTAAPYPIRGRMMLTFTQAAELKRFFREDIADGANSFTFPDPLDNTTMLNVRLASPPSWGTPGGDNIDVRLNFTVIP